MDPSIPSCSSCNSLPDKSSLNNRKETLNTIQEPTWLKTIPCYLLVFNLIVYIMTGALIFRHIDSKVAERPYYNQLIIAFELITTIGWGGQLYSIYSMPAKIFATFYVLFGVPILFSVVANTGWLITKIYHRILCYYKDTKFIKNPHLDLPLKISYLLLLVHQLVGVLFYNYLAYNFGIVGTVYFSITSIATTGLGDFHPDPTGYAEVIFDILYMFVGITILSCVFSSSSQYIAHFYFVVFKKWLKRISPFKNRSKVNPKSVKVMNSSADLIKVPI